MMTVQAMVCVLAVMIGLSIVPAFAGSCKNQNINGQSVQVCDNGYVETHRHGAARTFGIRNGGVERYPGNTVPPYAIEHRR